MPWHEAYAQMHCEKELSIVPGATHLFEEAGTLEAVARQAAVWFKRYLKTVPVARQGLFFLPLQNLDHLVIFNLREMPVELPHRLEELGCFEANHLICHVRHFGQRIGR